MAGLESSNCLLVLLVALMIAGRAWSFQKRAKKEMS
jgi:hypothetical protein